MAPDLSVQLEGQLLHVPPSAQSLHHSHWMALGNIETSIVRLQALVQVVETLQQKSPPRERGREGERERERERERGRVNIEYQRATPRGWHASIRPDSTNKLSLNKLWVNSLI